MSDPVPDYVKVREMSVIDLLASPLARRNKETRGWALDARIDELIVALAKNNDPMWATLYLLRQLCEKPSGFSGVIATRPAQNGEY